MEAESAAAGAARPAGSQESRDLAEFRKCNPPQFTGDADPEVDDRWIRELEKIFTVLGCPPERRLAYAVICLLGRLNIGGEAPIRCLLPEELQLTGNASGRCSWRSTSLRA
uniref:Uncharacterized protein n=1 Tax=Cajanus cajan TaxID=3821 RepID=A0A151TQJ8_CAJCA|nr:hypothetical protein KK1_008498 [Cajanus cajan]